MSDAGWQPARRKPSIPLTLLMGPLGAGKTILLNRLLRDPAFADTAVIVNETGATRLDAGTVAESGDDIIALGQGCVCCTLRGELIEAMERLLRGLDNGRIERVSRVIIETAGAADPAPVFALLTRHPYLSLRFHLDGIVTVIREAASLASDATIRHAASADRIVLAGHSADPTRRERLADLNPGATLLDDAADAAALTGIASDPVRWLAIDAFAGHDNANAFTVIRDATLSRGALESFLDEAATRFGDALVRVKGIIALADMPERPALVHGLGAVFAMPALLPASPDADRRTRLAVTARDLDRRAFVALFDAFAGVPAIDTPDRAAVIDNPLALPGFRPR